MLKRNNIVLLGMPGCGKSTIGRRLARQLSLSFIDTDCLLEQHANMPIQAIINKRGLKYMLNLEQNILTGLNIDNAVIATGGSAVYSQAAMHYLSQISTRVYLKISLPTLMKRVNNCDTRGLVKLPQHPLPRLLKEREALCEVAADVIIDNNQYISAMFIDNLIRKITVFGNG